MMMIDEDGDDDDDDSDGDDSDGDDSTWKQQYNIG